MPRTSVTKNQKQYRRFNDWTRGELKKQGHTLRELAQYLNISRTSLSLRLSGKVEWTFKEVLNTLEYLEVDINEIL